MKILFSFLILLMVMASCGGPDRKGVAKWQPVDHDADVIVDSLDRRARADRLTLADTILVNNLEARAVKTGSRQLKARAGYWKKILSAKGWHNDKWGLEMLEEAIGMCDSTRYPYDAARISLLVPDPGAPEPRMMRDGIKALDVLRQADDTLYYSIALSRMAHLLYMIGDTATYKRLNLESEHLADRIGAYDVVIHGRYERLSDLFESGNIDKAGGLIDTILNMPNFESIGWQTGVVYNYKYLTTHDAKWARKAYGVGDRYDDIRNLRTLSAGILADHYLDGVSKDSSDKYFEIYKRGLTEISGDAVWILSIGERLYAAAGVMDSVQLLRATRHGVEFSRKEKQYSYSMQEIRYNQVVNELALSGGVGRPPSFRADYVLWAVVALVMATVIYKMAVKRRRTDGEDAVIDVTDTLDGVDNGPEPTATPAEPETLTSGGVPTREQLEKRSEVSKALTERILTEREWENVDTFMADVNPGFILALRAGFPKMTRAEIRMACLCYMGMETKQIAMVLSIAPDSVKKQRQRLRSRLGLTSGQDLYDFLLAMGS